MARGYVEAELAALRALPLREVLVALAYHVALDQSFQPRRAGVVRWVVSSDAGTWELLIDGVKWFDTRSREGGGGAIDLLIYLESISFRAAVARLRDVGGGQGHRGPRAGEGAA